MYKNSGLKENYKQKLSIYLGANIREEGDEISIINDGSQFKISRPVLEEIEEIKSKGVEVNVANFIISEFFL